MYSQVYSRDPQTWEPQTVTHPAELYPRPLLELGSVWPLNKAVPNVLTAWKGREKDQSLPWCSGELLMATGSFLTSRTELSFIDPWGAKGHQIAVQQSPCI